MQTVRSVSVMNESLRLLSESKRKPEVAVVTASQRQFYFTVEADLAREFRLKSSQITEAHGQTSFEVLLSDK